MKPNEQLLLMIQWFNVIKISSAVKTLCANEYCFTSSNPVALDQGDALNWCQSNASKLVEVKNSSVQSAMSDALGGAANEFSYHPFTGGKRVSQSWSWISGKGIGSLSLGDLVDESYAYGYLIRQSSITLWARRPADTRQGYICQGEPSCSGANDGFMLSSSCYRSYVETLSWYSARNRCLIGGGDLATFDSITTNEGLGVINDAWLQKGVTYWIGIRREMWKWQTSDVTYSNWKDGHPVTYIGTPFDCLCVTPQSNWQWMECRCSERRPFICISPSAVTSSTTTTTTSTTTTSTTTSTQSTTTTTTTMQLIGDTSYERHEDIQLPSIEAISSSTVVLITRHSFDNSQSPQTQDSFDIHVAIGIGVGVGAGIVMTAVIIVVVVIIVRRGCLKREKTLSHQLQPPDLIALQTIGNRATEESPYGTVIKQPGNVESVDDGEVDATPNTIYADLQFLSQSFKEPRNESMNLVNEITEPTESLSQPMETERKQMECNGKLKDTVTRA